MASKKTKLPHPGANLGRYLHKPKYKAKSASEPKTSKNVRSKATPTVKKMSRRIAKQMSTSLSKGYFNG
jgi:hypothetical protein